MHYFSLCSACCPLFSPQVLNLAFRNQHPVKPKRQCNAPATWELLQTAAVAECLPVANLPQVATMTGARVHCAS